MGAHLALGLLLERWGRAVLWPLAGPCASSLADRRVSGVSTESPLQPEHIFIKHCPLRLPCLGTLRLWTPRGGAWQAARYENRGPHTCLTQGSRPKLLALWVHKRVAFEGQVTGLEKEKSRCWLSPKAV